VTWHSGASPRPRREHRAAQRAIRPLWSMLLGFMDYETCPVRGPQAITTQILEERQVSALHRAAGAMRVRRA